jgi:hypothetical protein
MKTVLRAPLAIVVALALSALFVQKAFAYITLNGIVPVSNKGLVILQAYKGSGADKEGGGTGMLKFKFSAPAFDAGVKYVLAFCIGTATNPCGVYSVEVPGGEERLAVVPASFLEKNVLTVSQGTKRPVPFAVTIE